MVVGHGHKSKMQCSMEHSSCILPAPELKNQPPSQTPLREPVWGRQRAWDGAPIQEQNDLHASCAGARQNIPGRHHTHHYSTKREGAQCCCDSNRDLGAIASAAMGARGQGWGRGLPRSCEAMSAEKAAFTANTARDTIMVVSGDTP